MCILTKKRIRDHLPNPWGWIRQQIPKNLSKILERNLFRFDEEYKFAQWRGVVGKRWEKAGKAEEKLKEALKDPKMGSLG